MITIVILSVIWFVAGVLRFRYHLRTRSFHNTPIDYILSPPMGLIVTAIVLTLVVLDLLADFRTRLFKIFPGDRDGTRIQNP